MFVLVFGLFRSVAFSSTRVVVCVSMSCLMIAILGWVEEKGGCACECSQNLHKAQHSFRTVLIHTRVAGLRQQ